MKVSELLTDESKWVKGQLARNDIGVYTSPHSKNAVKWCLVGAVHKCYEQKRFDEICAKLAKAIGSNHSLSDTPNIIYFNDAPDTTFEMVKDVVERANV